MRLKSKTPPAWTHAVCGDFNAFLVDHALCERKASATAMSFVAHYPDRLELVEAMIEMAIEELEHFKQVNGLLRARNLNLGPDAKDPYVAQLMKLMRRENSTLYFLDRLLIAGVIEARGCERFGLLADALPDGPDKEFYLEITRSEARHHGLFVRMARQYFASDEIEQRLEQLLVNEAAIIESLPHRAAVH